MHKQITILGTSHIAKQSEHDIKEAFLKIKPDFIAVELDRNRLQSLLSPEKKSRPSLGMIRQVGLIGFIFLLIGGYAQKKLGKLVGVMPGADMLYAVNLAKNNKIKLALVDREIQQTLRGLSKAFTFREKMRFLGDVLKIPFAMLFKKSKVAKSMSIDLKKVPEDKVIIVMMDLLKKRYPSLYKVLIDERNHIMTKRLVIMAKKNPNKKILCVVGAGHKKGIQELLSHYDAKIEVMKTS